jgi:xanthine/CO dehydrogenase XdhC/CoxF family maturation factor
MPKFHFEIVDGYKIEDPVGLDCKSENQAKEIAASIARQIAIDVGPEAARQVVVVDDDGAEIHKVPVKP